MPPGRTRSRRTRPSSSPSRASGSPTSPTGWTPWDFRIRGLMNPAIRPLWRDTENFGHRFCGIAVTVRYVPTNKRAPSLTPETFHAFEGSWYGKLSPEPFVDLLRPGSALVIDGHEDGDTGRSARTTSCSGRRRGAVGRRDERRRPRHRRDHQGEGPALLHRPRGAASGPAATRSSRSIGRSPAAGCSSARAT